MLRIDQLRLHPGQQETLLRARCAKLLRVAPADITACTVLRKAIDAREDLTLVYTVSVSVKNEAQVLRRCRDKRVSAYKQEVYFLPPPVTAPAVRPIVVGAGPAGLFAALVLARCGARPILLERGRPVEHRQADVERFWSGGPLDPDSNVQFGEGGAGAFSDGKLNTGTKDLRHRFILETLVRCGAPDTILTDAKPHVGTDKLHIALQALRQELEAAGADIRFNARLEHIRIQDGAVSAVTVCQNGQTYDLPARHVVLALGHSARDTFEMLYQAGLAMEPKPFAMGVRIEHLQHQIDLAQYGGSRSALPPADYKLFCHLPDRTVYTFCMCPGGYVVAAASEEGGIVTNGMSYSGRSGTNANAALLVSLQPKDFPYGGPLGGMRWQRELEQLAYQETGGYRAPAQRVGDFLQGVPSQHFGAVAPTYRPGVVPWDLRRVLPAVLTDALAQGLPLLGRKLPGFDHPEAVLTGPETRSSSPVRICRDASLQASLRGLFPCGEGAGYAGGILSAAADGIRCAEAVIAACPQTERSSI